MVSDAPATSKAPDAPAPKAPAAPGASKPNAQDSEKGYVRPHRDAVVHVRKDGAGKEVRCPVTILRSDHADFHARTPGVIDKVRCSFCRLDLPASEFVWHEGGEPVGT